MSQTASQRRPRRYLHFDALIQRIRQRFETLPEQRRSPWFPLTDTLMASGHVTASRQAVCRTQAPIASIKPVRSAIGMNSEGAM